MLITKAAVKMSPHLKEAEYESLLANLFRREGWSIQRQKALQRGADIIVNSGEREYVIEVKRAPEGRSDRLIPLLSQAVLQVQAAARNLSKHAIPVAIVAARHIPNSVAEQVKRFAIHYAPDVGVGLIDSEGFKLFHGFGLERFNSDRSAFARLSALPESRGLSALFSDLNQWMLKVLLAQSIPESLLSAPREEFRSGSQLAKAAGVSMMSASRFLRQLSNEGFLDERRDRLRLVRIEALMQHWLGLSPRKLREVPARWILRSGQGQLFSAVSSYVLLHDAKGAKSRVSPQIPVRREAPRVCIGLFAAADLLGVGFAQGVEQHLYMERLELAALNQLGLSLEAAERDPHVLIRIPENHESVFRPVVKRDGIPISDILQVWLDVSHHPARGKEQADYIWKRALAPCFQSTER
jgi:hypothetical protein